MLEKKNRKYNILTMGCQLNENDSEKLCGMLEKMGYTKTEDMKEANIAIFNTCCVRENAEERLFGKVGELKNLKEKNNLIIAIGGCMMQEKHITDKIKESYPFVDILFGTHTLHKFPEDLYKIIEEKKKLKLYFGTGITMVIAGWLWNFQMPIIKTIWTSSMVLVSSGYCFLLMGLFYYWIDYKGHRSGITWLKVYGMNSIVAYMLANVVNLRCIGESLFYGLEQYMGSYYSFLMTLWNIGAVYVIIWFMYKRGIFLKV